MTREDANFILANIDRRVCDAELSEALDMAIEALSTEPCEDAISRQAVLDLMRNLTRWCVRSEDGKFNNVGLLYDDVMFGLDRLPSVTPKQKMGHWIEKDGYDGDTYYDCSECGESWSTIEGTPWDNGMKYCPNCGAKMVEPQESEDADGK